MGTQFYVKERSVCAVWIKKIYLSLYASDESTTLCFEAKVIEQLSNNIVPNHCYFSP